VERIRLESNGLEYSIVTWGDRKNPHVMLLHGYMDAGGTWDLVAPELAAEWFVIAPDLRGFGESARVPRGAYYHFPDYIADVHGIAEKFFDAPFFLVGHSMSGTIATMFTGAFPERVRALALIEGLGPPDNPLDVAPDRGRRWISDLKNTRGERPFASKEDALARLRANHPEVSDDVLASRLVHLVRGNVWAFDPLHRTTSPMPFLSSIYRAYAARATCPVLFVSGGAKGFHPPDEEERLAAFRKLERVTIEGAGHMVHWTRPRELAHHLRNFFKRPASS